VLLYIIRKKKPRERERERETINSLLSLGTNPVQFYDHEAVLHTLDSLFLVPHSAPDNGWLGVGDAKWHCHFFSLLKTRIQRGTSFPQRCLVTTPRLHFVVV
jgi:hypothetical protein